MIFIKNFESFNDLLIEVRLSDVLNLKSKEDDKLSSEIDQLKNLSFDFEKNLLKQIYKKIIYIYLVEIMMQSMIILLI